MLLLLSAGARASDDGYLQICIAAAADFTPVYPTVNVPGSLREVTAVFALPGGESHDVSGAWYAVDAGDAAPANYRIGTSSVKNTSKGRLFVTLPRDFPVGKYRLDVEVDGKSWRSAAFNVVQGLPAPKVERAEDMLPTALGQTWTYDFVQQAGPGAKIDLPDIRPNAEGKYNATVTMSVAGEDASGKHVELQRNGKLVFEEWWRIDATGLAATKRKQGPQQVVLDPPQPMWRWPLHSALSWTYKPADNSYEETFNMWGPLPVATPGGEKPGYVVLADQRSAATRVTAEREYVPGVGLAREVDIVAVNNDMVSRQEISLRSASARSVVAGAAPAEEAKEFADELAGTSEPPPFHNVANPSLGPHLGRLVIAFPTAPKPVDARADVYEAGTQSAKQFGYGDQSFELTPGRYDVAINGIVVHDVVLQGKQDTIMHVGVLHVQVPSDTRVNVFAPGGQSALKFVFGETALGFPVGTVDIEVAGKRESVQIETGEVTDR